MTNMRAILIDWLVEVHYKFRVRPLSPCPSCHSPGCAYTLPQIPVHAAVLLINHASQLENLLVVEICEAVCMQVLADASVSLCS